jgi:hypothetical protein
MRPPFGQGPHASAERARPCFDETEEIEEFIHFPVNRIDDASIGNDGGFVKAISLHRRWVAGCFIQFVFRRYSDVLWRSRLFYSFYFGFFLAGHGILRVDDHVDENGSSRFPR